MKSSIVTEYKHMFFVTVLILILFSLVTGTPFVNGEDLEIPCEITTYGDAWEGSLGFGLFHFDTENIWQQYREYMVIMRTDGSIQYLRDTEPGSYNIVHLIDNETILFNGEPRNKVNLLDTNTCEVTVLPQNLGHHDVQYNPVTGNLMTLRKHIVEIGDMFYEHDRLVKLDPAGNILWSWTTADNFTIDMACNFSRVRNNSLDLTHCNSIDWDIENDIVYVNIRNLNTFCKINATNGELIWSLGEYGDFALFDKNGDPVDSLWYHGHSVEEVEPNVFLLFDNDLHNKTNYNHKRSRILEISINEDNMTAWNSWSWTAPREKHSGYWSDADRLPNGNRLGIFGTQHHDIANSTGAWLVEVSPEGDIVREYDFPYGWGMYRCEIIETTEVFKNPTFQDLESISRDEDVTLIYPSDSDIKPQGCYPASPTDWNAASTIYTLLDNVTETLDTDNTVVNQTDGSPILPSGSTLITVGGPLVNPLTAYYESDQTPSYNWAPIKCVTQDNWIEYRTRDGQEVAGMALEEVNDNSDLFLIQVFRDGRGRNIGICYGFGWKGTLAASKYIVREYEALTSGEASWMVGQWIDSNNNGFVNGPGDGDLYIVLDSN